MLRWVACWREQQNRNKASLAKGGSVMWLDGLSLAYRNRFVFRLPPMIEETRARFKERQA
jgi:hypothetical protein